MEGVDCIVVLPDGKSPLDRRSFRQHLAVSVEFGRDGLPTETSVLDEDPISDDPAGDGEIDDAEFLPKEVRAADLGSVTLEVLDPFA